MAASWWPRWVPRGRIADVAVVLALAVAVVAGTLLATRTEPVPWRVAPLDWLLIAAALAALLLRHRFPVLVAGFVLAVCGLYYTVSVTDGPILLLFVVALYSASAQGHLLEAALLGVVAMLAVGYGELTAGTRHIDDPGLYLLTGWLVAAIAVGGVKRTRQAYLREAEQRAIAAERGREQEALHRATQERLRIARELHDTLGHHISLINVQASAAQHRLERTTGTSDPTLAAIKQTSKQALRELRATLGVLREVDEPAPTAPVPGLGRLGELVDGVRAGGIAVRTEVDGQPRELPAEVELAAFRIVQESLTNVARHAAGASAVVRIGYTEHEVHVEVGNDGPAVAAVSPGNGIVGMGERASALGGECTAGPGPAGGFLVKARLPLASPPSP